MLLLKVVMVVSNLKTQGVKNGDAPGGLWAHPRNSPPSLLMIGNNYLKQLAFGARANSPVPIG